MEGYWYGDGFHGKAENGFPDHVHATDTNKKWIDLLCSIGSVRGWRCSVSIIEPKNINHHTQYGITKIKNAANEERIKQIDEDVFLVDGLTTLEELNEDLDLGIELDQDIDTISGFVINLMGRIPTEEDKKTLEYNNMTFKIEELGDKRIEKILINKKS